MLENQNAGYKTMKVLKDNFTADKLKMSQRIEVVSEEEIQKNRALNTKTRNRWMYSRKRKTSRLTMEICLFCPPGNCRLTQSHSLH